MNCNLRKQAMFIHLCSNSLVKYFWKNIDFLHLSSTKEYCWSPESNVLDEETAFSTANMLRP
jgi:hypothetical protein